MRVPVCTRLLMYHDYPWLLNKCPVKVHTFITASSVKVYEAERNANTTQVDRTKGTITTQRHMFKPDLLDVVPDWH